MRVWAVAWRRVGWPRRAARGARVLNSPRGHERLLLSASPRVRLHLLRSSSYGDGGSAVPVAVGARPRYCIGNGRPPVANSQCRSPLRAYTALQAATADSTTRRRIDGIAHVVAPHVSCYPRPCRSLRSSCRARRRRWRDKAAKGKRDRTASLWDAVDNLKYVGVSEDPEHPEVDQLTMSRRRCATRRNGQALCARVTGRGHTPCSSLRAQGLVASGRTKCRMPIYQRVASVDRDVRPRTNFSLMAAPLRRCCCHRDVLKRSIKEVRRTGSMKATRQALNGEAAMRRPAAPGTAPARRQRRAGAGRAWSAPAAAPPAPAQPRHQHRRHQQWMRPRRRRSARPRRPARARGGATTRRGRGREWSKQPGAPKPRSEAEAAAAREAEAAAKREAEAAAATRGRSRRGARDRRKGQARGRAPSSLRAAEEAAAAAAAADAAAAQAAADAADAAAAQAAADAADAAAAQAAAAPPTPRRRRRRRRRRPPSPSPRARPTGSLPRRRWRTRCVTCRQRAARRRRGRARVDVGARRGGTAARARRGGHASRRRRRR